MTTDRTYSVLHSLDKMTSASRHFSWGYGMPEAKLWCADLHSDTFYTSPLVLMHTEKTFYKYHFIFSICMVILKFNEISLVMGFPSIRGT